MSTKQYENLAIEIMLKDGRQLNAKIVSVHDRGIHLRRAVFSNNPQKTVSSYKLRADLIYDLNILEDGRLYTNGHQNTAADRHVKHEYDSSLNEAEHSKARKGKKKSRIRSATGEEEGWATEDFNKQEDFDFEGNLEKFKKGEVWQELRQEDQIRPEDRLHGHNTKIAHDKGNYHHRENIIQPPLEANLLVADADFWASSEGENGAAAKKSRRVSLLRRNQDSHNKSIPANADGAKITIKANGLRCPVVSPIQMIEAEMMAITEFGLSDEIIVENSGRTTASLALSFVDGALRISRGDAAGNPCVVILAGNHKSGARAICAARHLQNHGCKVITYLVGQESDLIRSVKTQLQSLRECRGIVYRHEDLGRTGTEILPELVIDALLGHQYSVADLWDDHNDENIALINWVNSKGAACLSLDVPSGVDGTTGATLASGLCVQSNWILSLGAPKQGLFHALNNGVIVNRNLFLGDISLPSELWSRGKFLRGKQLPSFGADFVIKLEV